MWGASAVPEPCRPTTGLAIASNSATPPVPNTFGFSMLALTSTTAVLATVTCRGSKPVLGTRLSPRYPTIPGTPAQLSSTVICPGSVQPWLYGSACGALVAATGSAGMIDSTNAAMRPAAAERRGA